MEETLNYRLDISKNSIWLRNTPDELALKQPYYCTEAGHFYAHKNFMTARSYKNSYLLFYTKEGSGIISQGNQKIILNKHQALLIDCRIPQSYSTYGDEWDHYWIHLNGSGVQAIESILIPSNKLLPITLPSASVDYLLDNIMHNVETSNILTLTDESFYLHQLLHLMIQTNIFENVSQQSSYQVIKDTAIYMQTHYRENIKMEDLLKIAHMSKSVYFRLFKQNIGTTPYQYLISLRITKAKELLELTDLPIAEIASRVGFQDQSTFTTRFSASTSITPLQYRTQAITNHKKDIRPS